MSDWEKLAKVGYECYRLLQEELGVPLPAWEDLSHLERTIRVQSTAMIREWATPTASMQEADTVHVRERFQRFRKMLDIPPPSQCKPG